MSKEYDIDLLQEIAFDLKIFARLSAKELDKDVIYNLHKAEFPESLVIPLKDDDIDEIHLMTKKSLNDLYQAYEKSDSLVVDLAAAEFAAIYLNNKYDVSPCESVWLDENGLVRQGAMLEIQDIYAKYNLKSANWNSISEDNLSLQLEFMAYLIENGQSPDNLVELCDFMDNHILVWLKDFAAAIFTRCESEFYASIIALTYVYCNNLRDVLSEILNKPKNVLSIEDAKNKLLKLNKKCS